MSKPTNNPLDYGLHAGPAEVTIRLETVSTGTGQQSSQIPSFPLNVAIPRKAVGAAGIIQDIGREIDQELYHPGDQVLAYLLPDQDLTGAGNSMETPSLRKLVAIKEGMFCKKPQSLSYEVAARLPLAFITAAAVLSEHFLLRYPFRRAEESSAKEAPTAEEVSTLTTGPDAMVLVTGGETPTGAMIIWLLHRTLPDLTILSTCSARGAVDAANYDVDDLAGDNELLIKHVCYLCSIGAVYAIDADATDTVEHLQAASTQLSTGANAVNEGIQLIVDTVGLIARRPELMTLLENGAGHQSLVDCTTRDIEADRLQLLSDDKDMTAMCALRDLLPDMMSGNFFDMI